MDKYFGEWYAKASIATNDELLKRRWAGIDQAIGAINAEQLYELVRLFRGIPLKDSHYEEAFRGYFFEADATFPPTGNDLEVRVLAGCSIAAALSLSTTKEPGAVKACLALLCSEYGGGSVGSPVPGIASRAQEYLYARSAEIRPITTIGKASGIPETLEEPLEALIAEGADEDIPALAKNIRTAIGQVAEVVDTLPSHVNRLTRGYNLLLEESNILWWLFAEFSNEFKKPFAKIPPIVVPLVAAKELADLTIYLPGRISTEAIILRVLKNIKKLPEAVTISSAASALPAGIRQAWVDGLADSDAIDFCPIFSSLIESTRMNDIAKGIALVESRLSLSKDKEVPTSDFAMQFFRECLLVQHI